MHRSTPARPFSKPARMAVAAMEKGNRPPKRGKCHAHSATSIERHLRSAPGSHSALDIRHSKMTRGLSPRVRGHLSVRGRKGRGKGSIPACAEAVQLRMSKCELQNEELRSVPCTSRSHPTRGTAIKASFNTCTPIRLRPLRGTSVRLPEAILHLTFDIRK
jgi:hypothetical protein